MSTVFWSVAILIKSYEISLFSRENKLAAARSEVGGGMGETLILINTEKCIKLMNHYIVYLNKKIHQYSYVWNLENWPGSTVKC